MSNGEQTLTCEIIDGKETVTIKKEGASTEETITFETDGTVLLQLKDIINKYQVEKWNGFNKVENVLRRRRLLFNSEKQQRHHYTCSWILRLS